MDDIYSDLNDFEKRLKTNKNLEDQYDSSEEEDPVNSRPKFSTEADVLKEKNRILMEKLFKSEKQLNEYKEMVEAIQGGKVDNKDKKIIELAKKNRSLQIQVESLKTKAAKAAEFALKLKGEKDLEESSTSSPKKSVQFDQQSMITGIGGGGTVDSEKRIKDLEKKVTKLRNDNQQLKGDLDKAIKCLERETGEIVNLDELLKDDSSWKGRAQKIEVLKAQVKRLKQEASVAGDGLSVISESTVFTGKVTHAEKNLTKIDQNKAKELEKFMKELDETKEELNGLKTKYKAAVARRDTLENQVKDIKGDFQQKMKILIEKTENDDKLIALLKQEVKRLEATKGVKSQLSGGGPTLSGGGASSAIDNSEFAKLKAENGRLRNQVKCLEIELEQKEDKVKALLTNCVGAPDERLEEKELRIAELEDRVELLEKENFKIKQEMSQPQKGFGRGGGNLQDKPKSKEEVDGVVKDLSKQNAILRRKLDDALDKLGKFESTSSSAFSRQM